PNGKHLVSVFGHGSIRLWDMENLPASGRNLFKTDLTTWSSDIDPKGRYVAIATGNKGPFVVSLADGTARMMPGGIGAGKVSFSPDGRILAAESWGNIPLWDLESNKVRILKPDKAMSTMVRPQFSFDGSLYSVHNNGNVYQWDLQRDTHRLIATGCGDIFFVAKNSPDLFVCVGGSGGGDREITTELKVIDVRKGKSYPILTHGN